MTNPGTSVLEFPVIVTDINEENITFQAQTDMMQCPKCAQGEGCGAYPWFQGFLFKRSSVFSLPIQQVIQPELLSINNPALLKIDRATMNILSVLVYGLALGGFFLGLFLSFFGANEGVQLIAAIIGLIAGVLLNKPISKFYLSRHLRITNINSNNTNQAGVTMCQNTDYDF